MNGPRCQGSWAHPSKAAKGGATQLLTQAFDAWDIVKPHQTRNEGLVAISCSYFGVARNADVLPVP